jgi:hypothetical protein
MKPITRFTKPHITAIEEGARRLDTGRLRIVVQHGEARRGHCRQGLALPRLARHGCDEVLYSGPANPCDRGNSGMERRSG